MDGQSIDEAVRRAVRAETMNDRFDSGAVAAAVKRATAAAARASTGKTGRSKKPSAPKSRTRRSA